MKELPCCAWINGREIYACSSDRGEVVVQQINIWEMPGGLTQSGKVVGTLPHGSRVDVLEKSEFQDLESVFYKVKSKTINGWVKSSFITWNRSSFIFFGYCRPKEVCQNIDLAIEFGDMNLVIQKDNLVISADGDPEHFDAIQAAALRFVTRIISAQSLYSGIPLQAEFVNWFEVPIDNDQRKKVVGFTNYDNLVDHTISNTDFALAISLEKFMKISPYLDLAVSDYSQAIKQPQHALIFLARAIESIENHFGSYAKSKKGTGKETIMQTILKVKKSDVEYVNKRANESHMRHASKDTTIKTLTKDELKECFKKTKSIINSFYRYLKNESISSI